MRRHRVTLAMHRAYSINMRLDTRAYFSAPQHNYTYGPRRVHKSLRIEQPHIISIAGILQQERDGAMRRNSMGGKVADRGAVVSVRPEVLRVGRLRD